MVPPSGAAGQMLQRSSDGLIAAPRSWSQHGRTTLRAGIEFPTGYSSARIAACRQAARSGRPPSGV